ncbi:putative phosphotransferase enzyme family protein [Rosellinia necatrix]|uniref:Putative phosphotransferase enzyme family protein n=1 Tax=Rosellinia necatrix TaxID=77044 RepID=A0A1W2THW7_ROSNE|nr:putative phosphotransferase enzyme family protein [Rosellinia necatrix]
MDAVARDEIKSKILQSLEQTPFAASSLQELSGGTVNFIYRAKLKQPLPDGTNNVLVKHGEEYTANNPNFSLTLMRCSIEEQCLKTLSAFPTEGKTKLPGDVNIIVRAPKFYHFDEQNNTQVQEVLCGSMNLKEYALTTYSADTPDTARPQCLQLGRALGKWLYNFHTSSTMQAALRETVAGNTEMQKLKHTIYFSWVLDRVKQFPSVLSESKDFFEKVRDTTAKEADDESRLRVIHGDFWTGNVLLPSGPIQDGIDVTVFVVDWEMAEIGLPNVDLGQMIGELYQLKLFKNITAGLWMVQGFVEGYGVVSDEFAFRTALQIGAHLLSFGAAVEGWGTQDQVEMVVRIGRDIMVHAWEKDREWFRGGDLKCLFHSI